MLQAASIEEMFDWAVALAQCPLPRGRRIAILTNAGGPGVIAADALEANALTLAEFSPETLAALSALLPSAAAIHNPVDILGGATSDMYADCLRLLLADPGVDAALVIIPPPPVETAERNAEAMIPIIRDSSKPVVAALMGGPTLAGAAELFRHANIPSYRFAERAVSALAALARRAEFLGTPEGAPHVFEDIDHAAAKAILAEAKPGAFLDPEAAERLMTAYGIPTAPAWLARSEGEAAEIASQLGFPVVMKIASPDIPHKSDVGGVLLNVMTPEEARMGFRAVCENASRHRPEAHLDGVQVQRMVSMGQEVIVGAQRDAQFEALLMFGSGGVEVEGLKDVAFALAPLVPSDAEWLLEQTWAGRKLGGFRSIPPADAEAVKEVLQRLGQLAHDLPEIGEIEINPLRALAPGEGAVALDVRVKLS